jgi:hypothetical protein
MTNPAALIEGAPEHFVRLVLTNDMACRPRVVVVQIADGQASF